MVWDNPPLLPIAPILLRGLTQGVSLVKLVVCADDFAIHREASEGIAMLAHRGRLSATSVMSLSPRWPQDEALLAPLRGRIDVGLHLDWTSEFALDHYGGSLGRTMLTSAFRLLSQTKTLEFVRLQLDRFEAVWQSPPDYVDGHQHIHQFPVIRAALVRELASRYRDQAPYLRISNAIQANKFEPKAKIIAAMGAQALLRDAKNNSIPTIDHLTGMYDFMGDSISYRAKVREWLSWVSSPTILMCHPASAIAVNDPIAGARFAEFEYFSGDSFLADLKEFSIVIN